MQQMREQCRRWFSSREPAHWMNAMSFASRPSEGRSSRPPVGPAGSAMRSNSTLVTTSGRRP
jgi:hypothetical protein